jgi:hypothetical protein
MSTEAKAPDTEDDVAILRAVMNRSKAGIDTQRHGRWGPRAELSLG